MRIDLEGQVALVTGGAQGIGRATAQALAGSGAALALVDIEAGPLARAGGAGSGRRPL